MTTSQLDTIYLDLAAGLCAAKLTCEDADATVADLLKAQYALDGMAAMVTRVRAAAPDEPDIDNMLSQLSAEATVLRLLVLERVYSREQAA
jgi:hypothetical protein